MVGDSVFVSLVACIMEGYYSVAAMQEGASVVAFDTVFQGDGELGVRVSACARLRCITVRCRFSLMVLHV